MEGYLFRCDNSQLFRDRMILLYPQTNESLVEGKYAQTERFDNYNFKDSAIVFDKETNKILIFPNKNNGQNINNIVLRIEEETWTKIVGIKSNGN